MSSVRTGASIVGQTGLKPDQLARLYKLAENNSKYRLKIISRSSSGVETTFYTSVPAVSTFNTYAMRGVDPLSTPQGDTKIDRQKKLTPNDCAQ